MLWKQISVFFLSLYIRLASSESWSYCRCGITPSQERIVGGDVAKPHSLPWMVALVGQLENKTQEQLICGGSLISSRYVLTAGHCVRDSKGSTQFVRNLHVVLGAHNLSNPTDGTRIPVRQKPIVYDQFNYSPDTGAAINDLALLRLDQDVELSDTIRPICLFSRDFTLELVRFLRKILLEITSKPTVNSTELPVVNWTDSNTWPDSNEIENDSNVSLSETDAGSSQSDNGISNGIDELDDPPPEASQSLYDKILTNRAVMFVREFLRKVRLQAGGNFLGILDGINNGDSGKLWVAGWGSTDEYGGAEYTSDLLRKASIKLQSHSLCLNAYGDDTYSSERNLCASDNGKDACKGDSGGPMMQFWKGRMSQIGIVSFGRRCGSLASPGVYTKVSTFLHWIVVHTKDSRFCSA